MSNEKGAREEQRNESAVVPRGYWIAVLGSVVVLAGAVALALQGNAPAQRPPAQPLERTPEKSGSPAAPKTLDCAKLLGRWVRTDTPYVIEIQEASTEGKLKASYFNPQPINVARAEAAEKDGALTVFVELRDANYPGCVYKLTYEKADDALVGTYYQAALQQTYEIAFIREAKRE